MNAIVNFLQNRSSVPRGMLCHPPPDNHQLESILNCAMSVPNHGKLQPWRFVIIDSTRIPDFSERAFDYAVGNGVEKSFALRFSETIKKVPMMIFVICQPDLNSKVTLLDQQLACGNAAFNIINGCEGLGFGAVWHTWRDNDVTVNHQK